MNRAGERKTYIIGSGIAGLASAVYLIRDGGLSGEQVCIFEEFAELRWCSRRIRRRPIRLHHAWRAHVRGTLRLHLRSAVGNPVL